MIKMNIYPFSRILNGFVLIYEILNNLTTKEELVQVNECIFPFSRNLMWLSCEDEGMIFIEKSESLFNREEIIAI